MRPNAVIPLLVILTLAGCENFDAMHRKDHQYRELRPGEPRIQAQNPVIENDAADWRSARRTRTGDGAISALASRPEEDTSAKPGPYVMPKFVTVPVISIDDSRKVLTDGGSTERRANQMAQDRTR